MSDEVCFSLVKKLERANDRREMINTLASYISHVAVEARY